jgi:hypothetical protein
MHKILGSVKYPYGATSPSDPSGHGLGFWTENEAQAHADMMNKALDDFDTDSGWNKEFWKTKPEPWIVFQATGSNT